MASLVLGLVGGYFFGPLGFLAGSALGSLLDPQKSEGPRMQDKHLQGSSYGEMIPIVYGTMRLAGQVMWTTNLVEHKHKTGGKGGPQVTTYTYTASFDVLICESPVLGVQKIWADGTLIYDDTGNAAVDNSLVPVTIYLGEADQQPDPTEEAELGVGNVPAYRGVCRCVFSDWDLGTWGNRLPSLTFQVFTHGGDIPWRVSSFRAWDTGGTTSRYGVTNDRGTLTATSIDGITGHTFYRRQWQIDGTPISSLTATTTTLGGPVQRSVRNLNAYNRNGSLWFVPDPDDPTMLIAGAGSTGTLAGNDNIYMEPWIYGASLVPGDACYITRYNAPGGVPGAYSGVNVALDAQYAASTIKLGTSDTGDVYVMIGGTNKMWKFDADLQLVHFWTNADLAGTQLEFIASTGNFHVYKNQVIFKTAIGAISVVAIVAIDPNTFAVSDYGVPLASANTVSQNFVVTIGGCLLMDEAGVFSVCPPAEPVPLSEIAADQSDRVGLDSASQYNVASLIDLVPGYLITRQSTGRDNIMQLRSAYFFDATESSGCLRFVKRGGPSIISIADNDLAAQEGGAGIPPPLITVRRIQETDLPATMWVTYFNPETDYQTNTQYSRRLVTQSQANARIDLSIALLDATARYISATLLYAAWYERTNLIALTSRKFLWYEPTDVITAHGYVFRVTGKSVTAGNIVQLEGVATTTGLFVGGSVGVPGSGFDPPIITIKLPTDLLLLDMPLAQDNDLENGLYAGMAGAAGATGSTWPGASLDKSVDSGVSYSTVGALTIPTAMGVASTVLGNFFGSNIFDELNSVHIVIGPGGGELISQGEDAVLNGANMCVIGFEWVQFKTAALTAPGEYDLTGLLRGRRGTEWAMVGHTAGERFALYPLLDAPLLFSELSLPRLYKAVTIGLLPSSVTAITFASMGAALQPYAPVSLGGGSDDIGDTTLQWIRRTRKGGAWQDFVDVPVSEAVEQFIVQIWDASYTLCARIITVTNAESTVYTAAQQVTDFGAAQETIYFTVGQIGAYTLGTQARGTAAGSGVTNDAPLAPIAPYNAPPSPVPGPNNPVNFVLAWSGSNSPHHTSGVVVGDTYVVEFTTDANPVGPGNIDVGEYGDPATYRYAVISTDTGGTMILPDAVQYGNSVSFLFGAGAGQVNLSTFTTYYLVVRMPSPPSVLGDNCDMVISF